MPGHESMNGRYYRTCSEDIKSSQGWFKNILLLGLLNFVPVFGQMTLWGYSFEWGHRAAWGVKSPMPYKIFGRKNSKMLRWGWFAIVICVVFLIAPYLVSLIGGAISGAAEAPSISSMYSHTYRSASGIGNALGVALGGVVQFVGWLGLIAAGIISWVGTIRMTVYDRLGAGLQFGAVWKMFKRDFGGLMRIFGMQLIVDVIIFFIGTVIFGLTGIIGGAGFVIAALGAYGAHGSMPFGPAEIVMMFLAVLPLLLIDLYIIFCMQAYSVLLVGRAVGYWCAQFDVSEWGTKDDPLPFESESADRDRDSERPERPGGQEAADGRGPSAGESSYEQAAGREPGAGESDAPGADGASRDSAETTGAASGDPARGHGPVGWRAAGTSAADDGQDPGAFDR